MNPKPEILTTELPEDELRPFYDPALFKNAIRGKYANRTFGETRIYGIILDSDISPFFPDSSSVNAALREYLKDHPQPSNPA